MAETKPNCELGYGCGLSCINRKETCKEEFGPDVADFISRMTQAIQGDKRTAGAVITEKELRALKANSDFLSTATAADVKKRAEDRGRAELAEQGIEVTDELVDTMWDVLPSDVTKKIRLKGGVTAENSYDPETDSFEGNPSNSRGKLILKQYLLQNGRDAYTGLPMDGLRSADLEHIEPMEMLGRDADRPENIALTSAAVNQWKGGTPLGEWASGAVQDRTYAEVRRRRQAAKRRKAKKNAAEDTMADIDIAKTSDAFVDELGSNYHSLAKITKIPTGHRFNSPTTNRPKPFTLPVEEGAPIQKKALAAMRANDPAELKRVRRIRNRVAKVSRQRQEEKKDAAVASAEIQEILREL